MKVKKIESHKKIWLDSMVGMTWGFLATLVVGTLVGLLAINQNNGFSDLINSIKKIMFYLTPFAIGAGVGIKLKLKPLQIIALIIAAGLVGHSMFIPHFLNGNFEWKPEVGISTNINAVPNPGDVFGAWIASVLFVYIISILEWSSLLDVILVPLIGVIFGIAASFFLTYMTTTVTILIEWVVENTANKNHALGIILAPIIGVIMGLALSLPTSSAAIAIAIKLHGDAATAAIAGTSAQMITFGIMTYMSTRSVGKSLAVGIGSSMIQMPNFIKKPQLLVIPAIISAIVSLLSVSMLPLDFISGTPTSGMGTSMLYGQIFTLHENGWGNYIAWLNVIFIQLIIPASLAIGITWFAFKKEIIRKEWLKI